MDPDALLAIAATVGALLLVLAGNVYLIKRLYVAVPAGKALLVQDSRGHVKVSRVGRVVLPIGNIAELVDLRTSTLEIGGGERGFRCLDRIRVTLTARVQIAVNPTEEDVARAAQRLGAAHVADQDALLRLFGTRFETAIATSIGNLRYAEVVRDRRQVEDQVESAIGNDLEGFVLQGVHFGEIAQVPIASLDPDDILDAEAIRTITEETYRENMRTAEMQREMRTTTSTQDLAADEVRLKLEERRAQLALEHEQRIEAMKIEVMKKE
jgi:uncharacterized membrane protein YqiK